MTSSATTHRELQLEQPISRDPSIARGLYDRADLLQLLDRPVTRRVTVISAPAGSGKTSLLHAWADRSTDAGRVAFVSVDRDQREAQHFWSAVLDAIRGPAPSIDSQAPPPAAAVPAGDHMVDIVLSEVAEQVEPVVSIIDDLHELRSPDALTQLEQLLVTLPSSARVVFSSLQAWCARSLLGCSTREGLVASVKRAFPSIAEVAESLAAFNHLIPASLAH
jgi:ATP/maltotriose-dependent transcriptional regulator MalT